MLEVGCIGGGGGGWGYCLLPLVDSKRDDFHFCKKKSGDVQNKKKEAGICSQKIVLEDLLHFTLERLYSPLALDTVFCFVFLPRAPRKLLHIVGVVKKTNEVEF